MKLGSLTGDKLNISRRFTYMKQRCYNPKNMMYKNYGGRGITICDEWLKDKHKFIDWALANGYASDLTIDRIDNNKGYSPDNCRWVNQSTQSRNTRQLHTTNKSGYRGVSWNVAYGKWESSIGVNKKTIKVGYYNSALEAAKAYDTYILANNLEHTMNGVILSNRDKVEPNTGNILSSVNSSGYVGVTKHKTFGKWFAFIFINGKRHSLKYHDSPKKAAIVREIYILENGIELNRGKRNFPELTRNELEKKLNEYNGKMVTVEPAPSK